MRFDPSRAAALLCALLTPISAAAGAETNAPAASVPFVPIETVVSGDC